MRAMSEAAASLLWSPNVLEAPRQPGNPELLPHAGGSDDGDARRAFARRSCPVGLVGRVEIHSVKPGYDGAVCAACARTTRTTVVKCVPNAPLRRQRIVLMRRKVSGSQAMTCEASRIAPYTATLGMPSETVHKGQV